jgi:hypothetical protein
MQGASNDKRVRLPLANAKEPTEWLTQEDGTDLNIFHCCFASAGKDLKAAHKAALDARRQVLPAPTDKHVKGSSLLALLVGARIWRNNGFFRRKHTTSPIVNVFAYINKAAASKWEFAIESRHYVPLPVAYNLRTVNNSTSAFAPQSGTYMSSLNQPASQMQQILKKFLELEGRATASSGPPHVFLCSSVRDITELITRSRDKHVRRVERTKGSISSI